MTLSPFTVRMLNRATIAKTPKTAPAKKFFMTNIPFCGCCIHYTKYEAAFRKIIVNNQAFGGVFAYVYLRIGYGNKGICVQPNMRKLLYWLSEMQLRTVWFPLEKAGMSQPYCKQECIERLSLWDVCLPLLKTVPA